MGCRGTQIPSFSTRRARPTQNGNGRSPAGTQTTNETAKTGHGVTNSRNRREGFTFLVLDRIELSTVDGLSRRLAGVDCHEKMLSPGVLEGMGSNDEKLVNKKKTNSVGSSHAWVRTCSNSGPGNPVPSLEFPIQEKERRLITFRVSQGALAHLTKLSTARDARAVHTTNYKN